MSGGIAYVWNRSGAFASQCNTGTLELESLDQNGDIMECKAMIERHLEYTDSAVARNILANWQSEVSRFVKVMPTDYKRVLLESAA